MSRASGTGGAGRRDRAGRATPSGGGPPLVRAHGVTVRVGGETVLHAVDFSIARGEIVTVVGPNGSGKTTLLRVLVGALAPSAGRVERRAGLRLGYVPQRLALDRTLPMTVRRFLDLPRRRSSEAARGALERVGAVGLAGRQMAELSGGQLQRVLLARALLAEPDLLVLDEATQGLDPQGEADFYHLVETLRDGLGCAVLMVSHELHVVMSASDRVVCLNGHVCCEGTPEVVSSRPEYRALFGSDSGGAFALYRHEHDHSHERLPSTAPGTDAGTDVRTDSGTDAGSAVGRTAIDAVPDRSR